MRELRSKATVLGQFMDAVEATRCDEPLEDTRARFRALLSQGFALLADQIPGLTREQSAKMDQEAVAAMTTTRGLAALELLSDGSRIDVHRTATFVNQLESLAERLLEKRETVLELLHDRNRLLHEFERTCGMGREAVTEIRPGSFAISLVVDSATFRDAEPNAMGVHYSDTIFNVIEARSEGIEVEQTERHEHVHNFLDGTRVRTLNEESALERLKSMLDCVTKERAMESARERDGAVAGHAVVNAGALIDWAHEEILAEFPNYCENRRLWHRGYLPTMDSVAERGETEVDLLEYVYASYRQEAVPFFSTALKQLEDCDAAIRECLAAETDFRLEARLRQAQNELANTFSRSIEALDQAMFAAERASAEALRDVRALSVLLKPSQWRQLGSYLRSEYGIDFDSYCTLYRAEHGFGLALADVRIVAEWIRANPLAAEDLVLLKNRFEELKWLIQNSAHGSGNFASHFGIWRDEMNDWTVDDFFEYRNLLHVIGHEGSLRPITEEIASLRLNVYIDDCLRHFDFHTAKEILNRIEPERRTAVWQRFIWEGDTSESWEPETFAERFLAAWEESLLQRGPVLAF